jgi:hypothetical protein
VNRNTFIHEQIRDSDRIKGIPDAATLKHDVVLPDNELFTDETDQIAKRQKRLIKSWRQGHCRYCLYVSR